MDRDWYRKLRILMDDTYNEFEDDDLLEESEVPIDNVNGWGAVPDNQSIDYMGLRVHMAPSIFLRLAASLGSKANKDVEAHIHAGGAIGAPFLIVKYPHEWESGDFSKPATIVGHEGRNRMTAIEEFYGDSPVEVHIFFHGGSRRRHITDDMIEQMNEKIVAEWGGVISGPFFSI